MTTQPTLTANKNWCSPGVLNFEDILPALIHLETGIHHPIWVTVKTVTMLKGHWWTFHSHPQKCLNTSAYKYWVTCWLAKKGLFPANQGWGGIIHCWPWLRVYPLLTMAEGLSTAGHGWGFIHCWPWRRVYPLLAMAEGLSTAGHGRGFIHCWPWLRVYPLLAIANEGLSTADHDKGGFIHCWPWQRRVYPLLTMARRVYPLPIKDKLTVKLDSMSRSPMSNPIQETVHSDKDCVIIHIHFVYRLLFMCILLKLATFPGWVLPYLGMVGRFRGDNPQKRLWHDNPSICYIVLLHHCGPLFQVHQHIKWCIYDVIVVTDKQETFIEYDLISTLK